MQADAIDIEVIVTRKREPELPPSFVCAICRETIEPDPWRLEKHRAPICFSCSNIEGHQVRIPHMTRGDHHAMQRLHATASALGRVAHWKDKGWH